jgi:sugar (pentulose or hexulose) kinase
VDAGSVVGELTPRAGRHLGLPSGTPILASGGDKNCEVLGGAAFSPASGVLSLGTALSLGTMVRSSSGYREPPLWTTAAPLAGWWTVEAGVPAGLATLDWLARLMPASNKPAPPEPPTRDGLVVVPFWLGHVSNPQGRGLIAGLTPAHGPQHLYLAAMEGLAFESRRAQEAIERAGGERMRNVRIVGGGTKNTVLCSIVSAVLDARVHVSRDGFAGARGAAAAAAHAIRPGPVEALARFAGPATLLRPDSSLRKTYARAYTRWKTFS